jgi:hypothetical protein
MPVRKSTSLAQEPSFPRYPRNAPGVRVLSSPLLRRMKMMLMVPVAKAI